MNAPPNFMPKSDDSCDVALSREENDLLRRYARRAARGVAERYAPLDPASVLAVQQRDRMLLRYLSRRGITTLAAHRILDVGCGGGGELTRLLTWGARPEHVAGIDLLVERVDSARRLHPNIEIIHGNAAILPWPDATFDIVLASTTFSSILDTSVRLKAAAEVARVLRPAGMLFWYDFWVNPLNRDTHAISRRELLSLFPGWHVWLRRATLAPPLARRVAGRHPLVAQMLQGVWPLRTHLLAVLMRPGHDARLACPPAAGGPAQEPLRP